MDCRFLRRVAAVLVLASALTIGAAGEQPGEPKAIRRYGLFVGANDGGPGRARLMYAESDCRAVVRVLEEAGGLDPRDAVVLLSPQADEVRRELRSLGARIRGERAEARRVEFVLYYSGHSDEESLMMGSSRLGYLELRDSVRALGADISIAILDSCASGAFIRLKGGQRRTPFLVDESSEVQGQVYLTSSSEDEASQESDALGGSFFTHALVSALRGAADFSLDGKVTLHEAYQYASQETLARTEKTQAGPQHPSWYINLNGTGDLVLTDLRSTSAGLSMAEELSGKLTIRDERGALVAEVRKAAGTPLTLALPPGSYTVGSYSDESSREARVLLREGRWTSLGPGEFRDAPRAPSRSRGNASDGEGWTRSDEQPPEQGVPGLVGELGRLIGERIRAQVEQALRRELGVPPAPAGDEGWTRSDASRDGPPEEAREPWEAPRAALPLQPLSVSVVPGVSWPFPNDARTIVSLNAILGVSRAVAGVELSGVMNVTSDGVAGLQVAGVGNVVSGEVAGVQVGGVFSIARERLLGAQVSGVFNVGASGGRAIQIAGVFNIAPSRLSGAQVGGVFNTAGEFAGLQVAGLVNHAGDLRGAQVGVVNVAGSARGLQLGVVNVSRSLAGLPVGLVNVVGDGLLLVSVGWEGEGYASVEIASGSGLYTALAATAGFAPEGGVSAAGAMAGLGVHLPLGPFFLAADAGARNLFALPGGGLSFVPSDAIPFPTARARAGVLLFGRIGAYAGCAVDCSVGVPGMPANTLAHVGSHSSVHVGGVEVGLYPRFFGGVAVGRQPRGR